VVAAEPEGATIDACLRGADEGQKLRDESKLANAKKAFLACARNACPEAVRSRCVTWLEEVEAATPSLVLVVRDSQSNDVSDASVKIDGVKVLDRLDGKPLAIDPGEHRIEIDVRGKTLSRSLLVAAAEKSRIVRFDLTEDRKTPSTPPPTPEPAKSEPSSIPWLGVALIGVGVVGVSSFAYFGITGKKELDDLENAPCAKTKTCEKSDEDAVKRRFLIADISLGVGVAALGAAVFVFASPGESKTTVGARAMPGGAMLRASHEF
jgi:hypothetical protein